MDEHVDNFIIFQAGIILWFVNSTENPSLDKSVNIVKYLDSKRVIDPSIQRPLNFKVFHRPLSLGLNNLWGNNHFVAKCNDCWRKIKNTHGIGIQFTYFAYVVLLVHAIYVNLFLDHQEGYRSLSKSEYLYIITALSVATREIDLIELGKDFSHLSDNRLQAYRDIDYLSSLVFELETLTLRRVI